MNDDFDIENVLRASLSEHARQAPDGAELAERIIADADHPRPVPEPRRWRSWTLPAVAAATVAAVVALIVGLAQWSHSDRHTAASPTPTTQQTSPFATKTHSSATSPATTSYSPATPLTTTAMPLSAPLTAFRVADLTFVTPDEGWALGSSQCVTGSGRCIAIMHTGDGGQTWTTVRNPGANIAIGGSCRAPCIEHIRFANERVGYAYGAQALFMTTNGGTSWVRQPGGADAVETLGGTVIRVSDPCGCPPGTTFKVQWADNGSADWHDATVPGPAATGDRVQLSRTGQHAYLAIYQNPAGGAGKAYTTLYRSADGGRTWMRRGEPCSNIIDGQELDTVALTTASDGSVTIVCGLRGQDVSVTYTSTDDGKTFTEPQPGGGQIPSDAGVGAASQSVLFRSVSVDPHGKYPPGLYRSDDGGNTWDRVVPLSSAQAAGPTSFLGFENDSTGRWVSGDGSVIWTTTDAGKSWTPRSFG